MQQNQANETIKHAKKKHKMKQKIYLHEKKYKKVGFSAKKSDSVLFEMVVFIQSQSIQCYVHEGKEDMSPVKRNPGNRPRDAFANMAGTLPIQW